MACEIEKLENEVSDLKAHKKLHLINDSNRELIFRSLKEKLPNYCISKCENVFTTDMLVRHMTSHKLQAGEKHNNGHHDGDQRHKGKRDLQPTGALQANPTEHSGNADSSSVARKR